MKLSGQTILLASGSPRRMETLTRLKLPFTALAPDIEENTAGRSPQEAVRLLARDKAEAMRPAATERSLNWILAADTLIDLDGRAVGKPKDREDAGAILRGFSGREHGVITGVCLIRRHPAAEELRTVKTRVCFGVLTEKEIQDYLDTGEWRDAAGAYKIQERGAGLVEKIHGSYSNVVGLPIRVVYGMLRAFHYPV